MTAIERSWVPPPDTLPIRKTEMAVAPRRLFRSIVGKLVLLLLVFVAVPVILYTEFRQADLEKQVLLL